MSYFPPPPEPMWNGQQWYIWNGRDWEVMANQPPPPPGQPTPAAGAAETQPSGFAAAFAAMSNGAKIVIAVAVALLLILAGGGAFALTSGKSSASDYAVDAPNTSSASPSASQEGIQTVPVSSAVNPFTPPVAQDAPDVPPVETQQPVEVQASSVGLYGGSKQINVCDKTKLINFLEQNPAMGRGWAQTIGISYSDIRTSITKWTSTILRSDTFVTNHGWENGSVTAFPSVLQAGTAVLVNEYGAPVTRCYCGNPLTAPPTNYPPTYYGPTWKWWKPTSITVIKQSVTIINTYTFVNIYKPSETYTVPAGASNPIPPAATSTPSR